MGESDSTSTSGSERGRGVRVMAVLAVASVLVGAASAWYLLTQLISVLRPLLVAVFLAYVLLPYHTRLRKIVGGPVSLGILATVTAAVIVGLAFAVSLSVIELSNELPKLQVQVKQLADDVQQVITQHAPWFMAVQEKGISQRVGEVASKALPPVVNAGTDAVLEAFVVALYLLFLLTGASNFPARVRRAYPPVRAEEILHVAGQVNAAIIGYLKAKVKSSLLLALPSGFILAVLGVNFSLLWTVLIFLCNFVPYVGSVVGYVLPVGFAFVQQGFVWQPITVAGLLLAIQVGSATILEPTILGNAVGLSPLVKVAALAFWGLLWGLPGMVLAVPLTVVMVIIMDHFESTRPLARLVAGG